MSEPQQELDKNWLAKAYIDGFELGRQAAEQIYEKERNKNDK